MKNIKLLLLVSLVFSSIFAQEQLTKEFKKKISEYDMFFNQISQKRVGVSNDKINQIKNPFIMKYNKVIIKDLNNTAVKKPVYILSAIFNNKAKINKKWYKINSKIGKYKLVNIRRNSVIIKNEHSKKELFIRNNDVNKIKFSAK